MRDIHCHILFGVDDGSQDFATSQAMLEASKQLGLTEIVCTPHARGSHFDRELIEENFALLKDYAQDRGVELTLGFEVYWEKLIEVGFEDAASLCIEGSNLLLLEFSFGSLPPHWERIVFELRAQGITPIIAHPERYAPIQKNIEIAADMKRTGCLLQLSANSAVRGLFGPSKKVAKALMERDLVDYVASDAHSVKDYDFYPEAVELFKRYQPVGEYKPKNLRQE
jgi:protein-tyrosine phosphatase